MGDNYWPLSTLFRSQVGNVRLDSLGTYEIIYSVTDGSGNVATAARTVIVRDTKAPEIKLIGGNTINLPRFSLYQDAGVVILDNYNSDAEIRKNLTITSNLPVNSDGNYFGNIEGLYIVEYKVRDLSNNISKPITRTVNVVASTSSVEDAINANNILAIYPNPSNGIIKVKLFEATNADVNVKVYNSVGALAKTITLTNKDLTEKQLDLTNFANGVYLVQVETEGKVYTHKISVVK
ncbi:MAG: T9SS type A sorting domain-containing protein [Candidatus Methylacidiphilales bacterium]